MSKKSASSKKKVLIASLFAAIFLIGAVISIVLVFAATMQEVETNVSIKYVADGVSARVSASYATVPKDTNVEISKSSMISSDDSAEVIEFIYSEDETTKELVAQSEVVLSNAVREVVYEYSFTNLSSQPFTINLTTEELTANNIKFSYAISKTPLEGDELRTSFSNESIGVQVLTEKNKTMYIYICAEIDKITDQAEFQGDFIWTMLKADEENIRTINLNANGGTGGQTTLTTVYSDLGVNMPVVYGLPTLEGKAFGGYYLDINDETTKYIDENGVGIKNADLVAESTLYAKWTDNPFIIENGVVVGLSGAGQSASTIVIPDSVSVVADEALKGSAATSITISNNVEVIGDSAFEDCTNLESVSFADTGTVTYATSSSNLKKICSNAFKGCISLTEFNVPEKVTVIEDFAFAGCSSLQSIKMSSILGEGTAELSAFAKLFGSANSDVPASLTTLVLTDSDMINSYAFANCTSLTSVSIENGMKQIKSNAFANCTGLTDLVIPKTVTTIEDAALSGCSALATLEFPYVIGDGTSSVNGFSKLFGTANTDIPATLTTVIINNGEISSYAFSYCESLTSVTIPNSVTSIGIYAFYNCTSLTTITIPNSVTSIGVRAFSSCTSLTTITIPNSVTSIGNFAFYTCTSLTTITIPNSVTSIGSSTFYGCTNLTSITIPSSVTSIGNCTFEDCTGLTSVTIPSSVTSIGGYAFRFCTGLTSVTIPSSVTSIGGTAFNGCKKLTELTFPAGLLQAGSTSVSGFQTTFFGSSSSVPTTLTNVTITIGETSTTIPNYAFYNCSTITSFTLAEGLTKLSPYCFYGCSGITEIVIPEGVTTISNNAFQHCTALQKVTIPTTAKSFGNSSFSGTTAVTEINFNATYANGLSTANYVFSNTGKNGSGITVNIGANVEYISAHMFCPNKSSLTYSPKIKIVNFNGTKCKTIGDYAFRFCSTVETINLNEGLTTLNEGAFANCASLKNLNLPSSLTAIGVKAIYYCSALTNLTIPSKVTSIGSQAFMGCSKLTSIAIPSGVTSIAIQTFEGCTAMTELTIHSGVTSIGDSAFYNCSSLLELVIPEGVTSIGTSALQNLSSLTNLVIPSSITSLSETAPLQGCRSLEKLECHSNILNGGATMGYEWVLYYSGLDDLYGCVEYIEDSEYGDIHWVGESAPSTLKEVVLNGGTTLSAFAFLEQSNLTKIVLPEGLMQIECYYDNWDYDYIGSFLGCSGLTSITIPSSVTSIGDRAFSGCTSLTTIMIPNSVTSIGDYAFYNCSNLVYNEYDNAKYLGNSENPYVALIEPKDTSITSCGINEYTKVIADSAFSNCTGLISITIPSSVTSIGRYAFSGCTGLTSITIPSSVTSIGSYAFSGCTGLTSITIPSSVTSIGDRTFSGCSNLTSVTFDNNTEGWWYASSSTATSGTSLSSADLADTSTAATYLTNTYRTKYWKRS